MADRMATEIWIGGKMKRSLLEEFPGDGLYLNWDEVPFRDKTEKGFLNACDSRGYLHLVDPECDWGEFYELEAWLIEHEIPFKRLTEGKYEYMPEVREYRPDLGLEPRENISNGSGVLLVSCDTLKPALARLLRVASSKKPAKERLQAWKGALDKLLAVVPVELPRMPKFRIVK